MNGNSGVNDFWGDGLLVDHGLDSLMNVMVDMFAFDSWCHSSSMCGLIGVGGVLELGSLALESLASFMIVAVVELLIDDILHLVMVLLRENFLMLDGLDRSVVMVLVNLAVDSLGDLLMTSRLDVLAGGAWSDGSRSHRWCGLSYR
jgi:hypothetical protein